MIPSIDNIEGAVKHSHARSRAGLYNTVWPLEHADTWRTQTAPIGGLPPNFDRMQLAIDTVQMDQPIVGATREKGQVFVMGGMPYLMNMYTKLYMTHSTYGRSDTLHQLLDDRKHVPCIAKLDAVTMQYQMRELTVGRDRAVNYPGGMLMHANGFVYAVAQTVLYKIDPDSMDILISIELPLVDGEQPGMATSTIYNGLQVLGNGRIVTKCFTAQNMGKGWALQIDPNNLDILVSKFIEVQSARLMIDETEPGAAFAYMPTMSQSRRFRITDDDFVLDEDWTATYKEEEATSTTWANGTLFMKSHVVFPDNSAPGEYITEPLHFFTHPVTDPPKVLAPHVAVSDQPGINFWKVGGDPYSNADHGTMITFTPTNELIAAYRLYKDGTLEKLWEKSYFISASPAIVTSTDLLYINDYKDGHDHFVVLQLSTGEELAYMELEAMETTMGIIFPGMNNDVYICSTETGGPVNSGIFNRIYLK